MTQLRLRDFFNPNSKGNKNSKSGLMGEDSGDFTQTHGTLFDFEEPENDNKTDVISFHSFTVHKSYEGRGLLSTRMSTAAEVVDNYCPSDGKPRQRKISEFNDSQITEDRIGATGQLLSFPTVGQTAPTNFVQSQPLEEQAVPKPARRDSQVFGTSNQPQTNLSDWFSKPAQTQPVRTPFSQLVSKTQQTIPTPAFASAPAARAKVTRNLDDFFKQSILVAEPRPIQVVIFLIIRSLHSAKDRLMMRISEEQKSHRFLFRGESTGLLTTL